MSDEATETFVVYGQFYWGKGTTLPEAKKNFTAEGGRLSAGYTVLTFDAETKFDGADAMGRYYFSRRDGKDGPTPPKEQIHKGRRGVTP